MDEKEGNKKNAFSCFLKQKMGGLNYK